LEGFLGAGFGEAISLAADLLLHFAPADRVANVPSRAVAMLPAIDAV
jgi:hypothetical protein